MLATDGRRLAVCSVDATGIGTGNVTLPDGGVNVPSHIIDAARKAGSKGTRAGYVVTLKIEGNKAELRTREGVTAYELPEGVEFPHVEQVIPSKIDFDILGGQGSAFGVNHVSLNPWYLLETCLACGDVEKGGRDTGANMHFYNALSPVVVCSDKGLGVIMPMRI